MPTEPNDEDRDYARRWTSPGLLNEAEIHALEHAHAAGRAAERERGRLALAACEAREMALREALRECSRLGSANGSTTQVRRLVNKTLSAPRDSEALKEIVLRSLLEGGRWVARRRDGAEPLSAAGYAQEAADERVEELGDPDDPDTKAIVARILSGGANG